jgi:hypothetical protein
VVADTDAGALNLDVYDTKEGLWNPEHGSLDLPEGWEFLPTGDTFVTRRVKAAGVYWNAGDKSDQSTPGRIVNWAGWRRLAPCSSPRHRRRYR